MMRFAVLACSLLLLTAAAPATPVADAEVSALTSMEGRYTLGPWEGSTQGELCLLTNSEPLAFADFELSGIIGHDNATLRLTPTVPVRLSEDKLIVQIDAGTPVNLSYRSDEGGFAIALTPDLLTQMNKGSFVTVGSYKYDLRGFEHAYGLFSQCLGKKLAANLPNEPLDEGAPASVAPNWQMITLKLGTYTYARYATLDKTQLGLWVHNVDSFVLSLTGPHAAKITPATINNVAVQVIPQRDGVLIPLSPELLRTLEASGTLSLKLGDTEKSFDIKDFRTVVTALQPYE